MRPTFDCSCSALLYSCRRPSRNRLSKVARALRTALLGIRFCSLSLCVLSQKERRDRSEDQNRFQKCGSSVIESARVVPRTLQQDSRATVGTTRRRQSGYCKRVTVTFPQECRLCVPCTQTHSPQQQGDGRDRESRDSGCPAGVCARLVLSPRVR